MAYLGSDGVERLDNQVMDMMDVDPGNDGEMERVAKTLNESRAKTIMLSSGVTKYNREMKSPVISGDDGNQWIWKEINKSVRKAR